MKNDLKSLPQKRLVRILAGIDPLLKNVDSTADKYIKKEFRKFNSELKIDAEKEIKRRRREKKKLARLTRIEFRGTAKSTKPIYVKRNY